MQQVQAYWTRATSWLSRQSHAARLALGVGALALFVVGCSLGALVEGASVSTLPIAQGAATSAPGQATVTQADRRPTATSAPPTATATAQPKTWVTLAHITGNQNQQTQTFHIPNAARIVWSVQSMEPYGGNFEITSYNSDGTYGDLIANAVTPPAQSGVYNVHGDIDVYLNISSSGDSYDIKIEVYR